MFVWPFFAVTHELLRWFDWLIDCRTDWLLTNWLIDWLTVWQIDWLQGDMFQLRTQIKDNKAEADINPVQVTVQVPGSQSFWSLPYGLVVYLFIQNIAANVVETVYTTIIAQGKQQHK